MGEFNNRTLFSYIYVIPDLLQRFLLAVS